MWTRIENQADLDRALDLAQGTYQRDLLLGRESLSGSTLKGRARSYGGRYQASRDGLLRRMTEAGIPWSEEKGERGRRILVIGSAS